MTADTKRALADALIRLMRSRRFDKITVKDVAEACGVNRQTFYYHFHDLYALVEWIFLNSAGALAAGTPDYNDWTDGLERLIRAMLENRRLILNIYNSISRETVSRYIQEALRPYCAAVVARQAEALETTPSAENMEFVANILVLAASGIIMEWIARRMKEDAQMRRDLRRIKRAMTGSIQLMLRNLEQGGQAQMGENVKNDESAGEI